MTRSFSSVKNLIKNSGINWPNLAGCFFNGVGVEKDEQKAILLAKESALAGDSKGQHILGWAFSVGAGVQVDHKQALHFW